MDQVRLKKIVQSSLDLSFSGVTLVDFVMLPVNKWDESVERWVPDSYSLFITLKRGKILNGNSYNTIDIENLLQSLIGFDCCVNFS
jgi:hypothetical protein